MVYLPTIPLENLVPLRKKYDLLKEKSAKDKLNMANMLLESFIQGDTDSRDFTRDLRQFVDMELPSDLGAVTLLTIKKVPEDFVKPTLIPHIHRVVSRYFAETALTLFFTRLNMLVCYFSFYDRDFTQAQTLEILEKVRKDLLAHRLEVSFALSSLQKSTPPKQLYREALVIHDHCPGVVMGTARDLPPLVPRDRGQMAMWERQFLSSVINREFYDAVSAMIEIIDGIIGESQPTLEQMRSNVFQRLETVLNICGVQLHPDHQEAEVYSALEKIMNCGSFDALRDRVKDFFAIASDCCGQVMQEGKYLLVKRFIEDNYQDPSMGAAMICAEFKFSASYLSKLVRRETGFGVVELIHSVRLERAKELLLTTTMPVQEVAEASGFASRWTFIRAFKNLEDMNPSEYRERHGS